MVWWQVLLLLVVWIVSSLIFGVVWALGHREKREPQHQCPGCGGYGQEPAPVQAPVAMRVISPVPRAPKK